MTASDGPTGRTATRDFMGVMDPSVVADAVLDLVRDDDAVAEERVVGALPEVSPVSVPR